MEIEDKIILLKANYRVKVFLLLVPLTLKMALYPQMVYFICQTFSTTHLVQANLLLVISYIASVVHWANADCSQWKKEQLLLH